MTIRMKTMGLTALMLMILSGSAVHAEFTPVAGFDQQLFPSYIIATASARFTPPEKNVSRLGDARGLLGVEVNCTASDTPIKVTIQCEDYFETSVFSGTMQTAGRYLISPKIKYRYDKLAQCEQAVPTSITYKVQIGNGPEEEQTLTCTMRSVNDCPFAMRSGDKIVDISYTFAAYVNEQHPFVDKLLREALDIGIVSNFKGYQANDPKDVFLQVYALWDLLVTRDMRYSSITATAADSDVVRCQHVRLIEDSINNSQANCVDGSVLFVSLLRKIGIEAELVLEPTHCYVAFYANKEQTQRYAIETVLLGEEVEASKLKGALAVKKAIPKDSRDEISFASFALAVDLATRRLEAASDKEQKTGQIETRMINIANARKLGILPIAFQKKEDFVWLDYTELDGDEEDTEESDEDWSEEDEEESDEEEDEE